AARRRRLPYTTLFRSVQEEGQGQGEDLGLAGAVVAAQQQPAVAEPELFVLVVEEVDEAHAQRLPALTFGFGQRCVHDVPSLGVVTTGSATAYRARAGRPTTAARPSMVVCVASPRARSRSSARATSSGSFPGARADLAQYEACSSASSRTRAHSVS